MPNDFAKLLGPEKLPLGWPWRVFVFSLILLGTVVVIYAGLVFGYNPFLNARIDEKDKEIAALAQVIPVSEQEALIDFYSQLANLQGILKDHVVGSQLFSILEKYTNKKVYYTGLQLDIAKRELLLDSIAQSYEVLAQQIKAFTEAQEVGRVVVNQSIVSGNSVRFQIALTLKEGVLK